MINEFLQAHCFEMEKSEPAYRYIYTVSIPDGCDKKAIFARSDFEPKGSAIFEPRVSIIIPLFNQLEFTQKCLAALCQSTTDGLFELILIDNGSSDGTKEFLQTLSEDNIKVITNERNLGFAKASNQGAQAASAGYLLFLNNDTQVLKGWLEPMLDVLDKDASVTGVGCKLLYPDGTIQHAGVVVVDNRKMSNHLDLRHIYMKMKQDLPEANFLKTYHVLTAACFMVRKKAFNEVGGFDEAYWNCYEDVDLCFKLVEKGGVLVYQPRSVVVHYESQSGPERFVRYSDNLSLLHEKWIKKIKPDLILEKDGRVISTGEKYVKLYAV